MAQAGRCPLSRRHGWASTFAVCSVAPRAAVAGSAQARASKAPSGEGAASGWASWKRRPVHGLAGSRAGWRLGEERRRPAGGTRAGAGWSLLCGNNNGSCHPVASGRVPLPPASAWPPEPTIWRGRGGPPALTVSEASSAVPSDMAAALPGRPSALRARLSGCAAPPAARPPAASGPPCPRACRDPAAMVTVPPIQSRMWPAPGCPAGLARALGNPPADLQGARRCGGGESRSAEAAGTRLTVPGVRPPPSLVEAPPQVWALVTEQDASVY